MASPLRLFAVRVCTSWCMASFRPLLPFNFAISILFYSCVGPCRGPQESRLPRTRLESVSLLINSLGEIAS